MVTVLAATVAGMANAPDPLAVPEATTAPPHPATVNSRTVEFASAVPFTVGVRLFDGDGGRVEVSTGAAGAMLSCVYVRTAEQTDTFPGTSVAVATKLVVALAGTVTVKVNAPPAGTTPVATGVPVHTPPVKRRTVEPTSAVPSTCGVVLVPGEAGLVPVSTGAAGGML